MSSLRRIDRNMKIYFAGTASYPELTQRFDIPYILESFYYFRDWQKEYIKTRKEFLLDSGAFTFMQNTSKKIEWEDYIDKYANFIIINNIKNYFELDIDNVVGYTKVMQLRKRLENITNTQCIPVWHKSRGIKEYERLCNEYPYVAIGGIVSGEIRPEHYPAFIPMIKKAHDLGTKVHGLGFTRTSLLPKYHFDSVDSTSWTSGCRFGSLVKYRDGRLYTYGKQQGKRAKTEMVHINNLKEWIKFQKYAEANL